MRIFYLISSVKIGGAEIAWSGLVPEIQKKGHVVHVAFFHDGPVRDILQQKNITTRAITGPLSYYDPISIARLIRSIREFKPDIIHTSLWAANVIGRILGNLMGIPVVSDLHGNCQFEGWLRNLGDQATAPLAAANVAVSASVRQAYLKLLGVPETAPEAPLVVPNGIDIAACHARAQAAPLSRAAVGIPPNAYVIGSIGRLEPIKGYDLLLEAFALMTPQPDRPLVLYVVGDGSCRPLLEHQARQLGITNRVIFAGFHPDPFPFYPLLDCFALSSHSEGLSIALLEAMSFSLPIVTTNQTMHHDIITHELDGLIVTTRNPLDYMRVLERLYLNPIYRKELGMAAWTVVRERHTLAQVVTAYENLYRVKNKTAKLRSS